MKYDYFNLSGLTALIIDDDRSMRSLLVLVLRSLGAGKVLQAETAKEGMAIIQMDQPDFITLDHRMDDMDGVSLVKLIRQSDDSPNPFLPILMISGFAEPDVVTDARDAGINEFLTKPVSVESVSDRLTLMISSARPFVRSKEYFGPDRRRRKKPLEETPMRRASDKRDAEAEKDKSDEGLAVVD